MGDWRNQLYFGDNLDVLRNKISDESVDLIYLDPPFNSKADYNVLFKEVDGTPSAAQIHAFTDFWHWDEVAARTFHELVESGDAPPALVELLQGFARFLGHNDMLAYLVMMAPRLVELRRVLKPTGSIYLHCDPTAGRYLNVLMDAIFGNKNFRNEIIWHYKRWPAKQKNFQRMHDTLLFYSKTYSQNTFNIVLEDLSPGTLKRWRGKKSKVEFEGDVRLVTKMTDEDSPGRPADDVWDIPVVNSQARERLGYPTQKPQELLERIVQASSNEGDVVLDPFCGCGTTIAAAQALGRRWIGIDVTYLAINLIKNRLADHFADEVSYEVHGIPMDWESARELAQRTDMPRKEFEIWALSLVSARPKGDLTRKGGGDKGIDGVRYFIDGKERSPHAVIVQVKSDAKPKTAYVRDLVGTMEREKAVMGALILLYPPTDRSEIKAEAASAGFFHSQIMNKDYPRVQALTVEGLLNRTERLELPQVAPDDITFKKAEKIPKDKNKQKTLDV
ncbi:site-specific DNA-methyltransferase [bacterium]|nr:site-specific DNA-methyltransferase [bacterium]